MKPITLHPGSLLAGIGVAVLAFVAMGQSVVKLPPQGLATGETEHLPRSPAFAIHPRDYVTIREGAPYTVPANKILAVTGLGSEATMGSNATVHLLVDGIREVGMKQFYRDGNANQGATSNSFPTPSVMPVTRGFGVPAGSVVDLQSSTGTGIGRAWGFLAGK